MLRSTVDSGRRPLRMVAARVALWMGVGEKKKLRATGEMERVQR
jgi:hypothetical protein